MTIHKSNTCKGIVGFRQYLKDNKRVLIKYAFTEDAKTRVFLDNGKNWLVSCNIGKIEIEFKKNTLFRCDDTAFVDVRFISSINITKMLVMINDKEWVDISVRGLKRFISYLKLKKFKMQISYIIKNDNVKKILSLFLIFRRLMNRYKEKIKQK